MKIENPNAHFYEGDEGKMMMELSYTIVYQGETIDYVVPRIDLTSIELDAIRDPFNPGDQYIPLSDWDIQPYIRLFLAPSDGKPYITSTRRVVDMTMKELQEKIGYAFRIVPDGTL